LVSVPAISLNSLLMEARRHGDVTLVKLDLEGMEFPILESGDNIMDVLRSVPEWLIEFHPTPQTSVRLATVKSARSLFRKLNYHEFSRNGVDYLFWRH
jgi:hypothetical protein